MADQVQTSTDTDATVLAVIQADPVAGLLGARYEEIRDGYARVAMDLAPVHLNFNGTPHGGLIFTLADLALGAACNAGGTLAALVSASFNFVAAARVGATIVAEAREVKVSRRLGLYDVSVTIAGGGIIASGQSTVYRWPDRAPGPP